MTAHDNLSNMYVFSMQCFLQILEMLRGHHIYKDILIPFLSKTLSCSRKEDTKTNPYAVSVNTYWGEPERAPH